MGMWQVDFEGSNPIILTHTTAVKVQGSLLDYNPIPHPTTPFPILLYPISYTAIYFVSFRIGTLPHSQALHLAA